MPLLLGNHDKNIITATDVIETEPLSWSTKEIVIPGLEQDNKAQAITFEFAEGKGMVVIERGGNAIANFNYNICLLYTSPSPRDATLSRMPASA